MSKTGMTSRALVLGITLAVLPAPAQAGDGEEEPAGTSSDQAGAGEPDAPASIAGPWMEGVPAEAQKAAREIFLQGNVLIKDTLFGKAAARYKEAIALWKHPAFYFNLAIAQLALDQPIEAYHSLEEALRHGEAPLGAYRYRQARSHLQRLDRELAHIEIVCDEPGATVSLDGKLLFEAPGRHAGHVRPGSHQLVAHKTRYLPETRQLVLSPGQRMTVEIELRTLEEVRDSSRRWAAWKPWAVAGAGAFVSAAGGVVHWRASADYRGFDDAFERLDCAEGDGCTEAMLAPYTSQLRRAVWEQRVAVTAYAAGGAAITTGLILVYLNRPRLAESETGDAAVSIAPMISSGAAGFTALLRF